MSCERCGQDERTVVRRAKVAERAGRVVLVLGVPMEECVACGERFIDWEVARRLDALIRATLAGGAEVATRHFDEQAA
ncbi:MAG: YgiT-type zinc finger protein [Acidimicrobiales bacterium]